MSARRQALYLPHLGSGHGHPDQGDRALTGYRSSPPGRLLVAGLLICLTGIFLPGASAQAAPAHFVYELCDPGLPGGAEPQLTFGPDGTGSVGAFDTCGQPNGSTYLYQLAHSAAASNVLDVSVPTTPAGWVETETLSAGSYRLGPGNERSYVRDEGWPLANDGEQARTFFVHSGAGPGASNGDFPVVMACSPSYAPGCEAGGGIYVRYISALEVDPSPPTVASPGGPLLAGGVIRGNQQLSAAASDLGGGVQDLQVLVNGSSAAPPETATCQIVRVSNSSYEGLAATTPTPCPSHLSASWSLDTANAPFHEGANAVQVCAEDFATQGEPNRTCSPSTVVTVDDSCTESPVPGAQTLTAGFSGGKGTLTVGHGKGAAISGELIDEAGNSMPGATVCVEMQTQGSHGGLVPAGTATTDPQGHFTYVVPPGPDRKILLGYRHDSFQVEQTLSFFSQAGPTIKAGPRQLRDGQRVNLRGTLPEPKAAGRVVVLQANIPGSHRWITFRKATTGERGRYRAHYDFRSTTRRTTYRFRAVVPEQAGYPWVQGHSKPVSVTVSR